MQWPKCKSGSTAKLSDVVILRNTASFLLCANWRLSLQTWSCHYLETYCSFKSTDPHWGKADTAVLIALKAALVCRGWGEETWRGFTRACVWIQPLAPNFLSPPPPPFSNCYQKHKTGVEEMETLMCFKEEGLKFFALSRPQENSVQPKKKKNAGSTQKFGLAPLQKWVCPCFPRLLLGKGPCAGRTILLETLLSHF